MTSLLGRLLPLFSGPRRVEDLFTEAVVRLFERRPELCLAWLRSEGLIPSGEEDDKVHPRVASQKWLGTLSQHDKASRADLQIEVLSSISDEPEGAGVVGDVILVESKIGSREGKEQLRRYAKHLHHMRTYRSKTLLYITRGYDPKGRSAVLSGADDVRFEQRRWRDFYRFLQGLEKDAFVEEVMAFMEEQDMGRDYRFSADDLIALSGLPRALDILAETIDAEVRGELARFSGNKPQRAWANLMQQLRTDEGYWVYADLDNEYGFGCYVGYEMRYPDGYPRLQVGLFVDPGTPGSEVAMAAIERIARLEGWQLNPENAEEREVRRERNVASLLGKEDHVVAAKTFFIDSIRQLREELTAIKKQHPELPWHGV
jgi:hypothetical protein